MPSWETSGESADSKHKDEIEVLVFLGRDQQRVGIIGRRRRNREGYSKRPHLVHAIDKATPGLLRACATVLTQGGHDHASQGGHGPERCLIVKLNDVLITAVTHEGSSDGNAENVSLSFAKIALEYGRKEADGSLDTAVQFNYDFKTNKVF